jgi:hypothetical protein
MQLAPRLVLAGLAADQASPAARRLADHLKRKLPELERTITKDDVSTQDLGATVVLMLGAPAVVALAQGIADFLRREHASIDILTKDKKVVARGLKSEDAAKIAEAILQTSE